ncbi:MAG: 4'-phosphopantetheinyl transferase superfamily protein [Hyphomonadaceae bacterium]|jgi:4'-phosphopantetheinyl transferase|nr:4'-phosphopantetheinyl transferase superfamily protein [Hyphomonadaceae bacterium]
MTSIRVYRADLGRLSTETSLALLDEAEQSHAARVSNRQARDEFARTRALLRALLARHTGRPAGALQITAGAYGKPALVGAEGVHFNVSHSGGLALIAIAPSDVGIDIERMDSSVDYRGVAGTIFSRAENERLHRAPEAQRGDVFFSIWTRKEAYLKATGQGFSSALPMISTAAGNGAIEDRTHACGAPYWHAFDVPVPAHFKAALVTTSRNCTIDIEDVVSATQSSQPWASA